MRATDLSGFSILELLAVLAIAAVLSTLVLPSVVTVMRGTQITRATDELVASLSLARQRAITGNHPVEVRFYKYESGGSPFETFRAFQAFRIDDDGSATAIGRKQSLPTPIMISPNPALSSLIANLPEKTWTTVDPKVAIPQADRNYQCRAFRFLPDGSASSGHAPGLSRTDKWFLTFHNELDGDDLETPPDNYATIQIDPANGSIKVWRP